MTLEAEGLQQPTFRKLPLLCFADNSCITGPVNRPDAALPGCGSCRGLKWHLYVSPQARRCFGFRVYLGGGRTGAY